MYYIYLDVGRQFFPEFIIWKTGVTLQPHTKLSMSCEDIFLKIEDCNLWGGIVLYAGSYYISVN